jgi:hypothetical protein
VSTNEHALEHEAEIQDGTTGVAPKEITAAIIIDEGVAEMDSNEDDVPPPLGPPRSENAETTLTINRQVQYLHIGYVLFKK